MLCSTQTVEHSVSSFLVLIAYHHLHAFAVPAATETPSGWHRKFRVTLNTTKAIPAVVVPNAVRPIV